MQKKNNDPHFTQCEKLGIIIYLNLMLPRIMNDKGKFLAFSCAQTNFKKYLFVLGEDMHYLLLYALSRAQIQCFAQNNTSIILRTISSKNENF